MHELQPLFRVAINYSVFTVFTEKKTYMAMMLNYIQFRSKRG